MGRPLASLTAIKNHPLLPGTSLLAVFLLLTGQTFTCCLINQTIAGKIAMVWAGIFSPHSLYSHQMGGDAPASGPLPCHAHCHGATVASAVSPAAMGTHVMGVNAEGAFSEKTSCLSERVEAGKPMAAGGFAFELAPVLPSPLPLGAVPPAPVSPESPRPRNNSGPPLYLKTLRILV